MAPVFVLVASVTPVKRSGPLTACMGSSAWRVDHGYSSFVTLPLMHVGGPEPCTCPNVGCAVVTTTFIWKTLDPSKLQVGDAERAEMPTLGELDSLHANAALNIDGRVKRSPSCAPMAFEIQTRYRQTINLINLRSRDYDTLQSHPLRGIASIASFIGDEARVQDALDELDRAQGGSQRLTAEQWSAKEETLRAAGLVDDDIDLLRKTQAPLESGAATLRQLSPEIVVLGESRSMLERSVLFDQ